MRKNLFDHRKAIASQASKVAISHFLLCGITPKGELLTLECVSDNERFRPEDVVEQIAIRGESTPSAIYDRLAFIASA